VAILIDSYSEVNQDYLFYLYALHPSSGGFDSAISQSFTCGQTINIYSAKFYLKKKGSPIGNGHAVLYAMTGTYGTNGRPTGSALATSDDFDVSGLTTSLALYTFKFTGDERYEMQADTKYCIVFENPTTGTISFTDCTVVGADASSPSHSGNYGYFRSNVWGGSSGADICFYVYAESPPTGPPGTITITGTTHFE